jgi:arylsulfatase A-like enzyme
MKMIFLLFDSLNRKSLRSYGGSIDTPNFDRLAARTVQFETHYTGSLPCMPARRDHHTGRYGFFHAAWGPLEPFDNSYTRLMRENGIYTHLVTDHLHYFEDGGLCYHTTFDTWINIRGQEYDPWKPSLHPDLERYRRRFDGRYYDLTDPKRSAHKIQHLVNRDFICTEPDFPLPQCFDAGLEFLETAAGSENWFLQLECFDPHEPFHVPERLEKRFGGNSGLVMDWPNYSRVTETPEEIAQIRNKYGALVTFCDEQLGRLLDWMDATDAWVDTALIVTSDHGFLLSEHDWWAKVKMPQYQEVSHIPLMMHHPLHAGRAGERRSALTSVIDILPTILDCFGVEVPTECQGVSLMSLMPGDHKIHDVVLSGVFGGPMLICDGRYAYHRRPKYLDSTELYEYRLLPMHMRGPFSLQELRNMELVDPFDFTKEVKVLKIKARDDSKRIPNHDGEAFQDSETRLFDLSADPTEGCPIDDDAVASRLLAAASVVMLQHDAPREMFERFEIHLEIS